FFSSRRRHTRSKRDWSSDVCSSDLESSAMDESLTERRRVNDEDLRIVKFCCQGLTSVSVTTHTLTVLNQKAPANYVPAAAVIRRGRALSGIIVRRGYAGGSLSLM